MKIIITDVTNMRDGIHCVAGWDWEHRRMIRPLPDGSHWPVALVDDNDVEAGAIVEFEQTGVQHKGSFPHLTEDLEVDPKSIRFVENCEMDWFEEGAPQISESVAEAFDSLVENGKEYKGTKQHVYVPVGSKCASLAGIAVSGGNAKFTAPFEKLRVIVHDGEAIYDLPVVCRSLVKAFAENGVEGAQEMLAGSSKLHVRLGLARAYGEHSEKCFLMVNGIHF